MISDEHIAFSYGSTNHSYSLPVGRVLCDCVDLDQDFSLAGLRNGDISVDLCGLAFDRDESFHCGGHCDLNMMLWYL